jgi:hypothetical protein
LVSGMRGMTDSGQLNSSSDRAARWLVAVPNANTAGLLAESMNRLRGLLGGARSADDSMERP